MCELWEGVKEISWRWENTLILIFITIFFLRMNREIMQWSSEYLYDGLLEAHESVADHLLRYIILLDCDQCMQRNQPP